MIYELRKYEVAPGRMNELHERFKNHTLRLFKKFGIQPVAFWISNEEENCLTYLLKFDSLESQKHAWESFMKDDERIKIWNESNKNGKLVTNIISKTLNPTEYSPMQ